MFLIVGLGNPGDEYAHTRHNVGFDVVARLSEKLGVAVNKKRGKAIVGEGQFEGEKVVLALPQTFMNLSGEAVQELLHWYKLTPDRLLVVYDDIDIAPGWLRIRKNGSAGTHNGMRNIVECIGSTEFPRLRVGTGGKPPEYDLVRWVLGRYTSPEDRKLMDEAYDHAADAAVEWMRRGVESAMNRYNTKKPKAPKQPQGDAE